MDHTIVLPADLYSRIEGLARIENKTPVEVIRDAVERTSERSKWQRLFEYGRERARALGIDESDVERLIAESRQEVQ
jgi:predicted transcriptional regulator